MISVTNSPEVPFGEVRLGAGMAAALSHAPTLTPLRVTTGSRTVVSEVPKEWGEIRQKLEFPTLVPAWPVLLSQLFIASSR